MDNLLQDSTISISSSSITTSINSEEVSGIDCELINMSDQEKDLINRMYRMVGDRWHLIAGRIPGRKAEEIERFWIMTHTESFAQNREENGA